MGQNLGIGSDIVGPNLTINTVGNGFFTAEEALYFQVNDVGTFQTPARLAEAIFPYDITTHKVYNGTGYYLHFRTILGSTSKILTTVADTGTVIYTKIIN